MAEDTEGKHIYKNLGFLDFLAYYVPGIIMLIIVSVLAVGLGFKIGNPVTSINEYIGKDAYIRGAIWTVLGIVIPYVLGHLIFPVSYIFGYIPPFKAIPKGKRPICVYLKDDKFCTPDTFDFANCIFSAFHRSTMRYSDLMISRFRTLGRFCRAMLLPTILLAISLLITAPHCPNTKPFMYVSAIILFGGFWGFGRRYRRYETRWRQAICIAAGNAIALR